LGNAEWDLWQPHLEPVTMPLGQVLYEAQAKLSHVYFPTTAVVSLLHMMQDGATAEIAIVGNEGLVGISLFLGGHTTSGQAVVQSAGEGLRLRSALVLEQFNRGGPVLHLLLRYTQALITQMAQTAVCNRHHSVDQRLCRSLLLTLDRVHSNQIVMTQELLGVILGVRRASITQAAGDLQKQGLIRYDRGHITLLDRAGLEQRVCECYSLVKREYERLLPDITAL